MGARLSANLAANASKYDVLVDSVVLVDPPGMTKRSLYKLLKDFAGENPNQAAYNKLAPKTEAQKESGDEGIIDMLKFFISLARQGTRANYISYTRAMARADLPDDMMMALGTQPDLKITMIYGTASRISNPDTIMDTYHRLSQDMRDRVRLKFCLVTLTQWELVARSGWVGI
jgi:hypothetical protein